MSKGTSFEPRVRFNWGFWDAIHDRAQRRKRSAPLPKHDPSYTAGYRAGESAPLDSDTSDAAWRESQWRKKHPFGPYLGNPRPRTFKALIRTGRKPVRVSNPSPRPRASKRPTMIGDQVGGIWYRKGQPHVCDAACKKADHWYEHVYEKKRPIWGRSDGHIEI